MRSVVHHWLMAGWVWGLGAAGIAADELPADLVAEVRASYQEKAPAVVRGRVFLDTNGNGTPDPGETGLRGVGVTDGVTFVETDETGAYEITIQPDATIPWTPARTVSVSWPEGHWPVGRHWHRLSDIPEGANAHFPLREDRQTLPFAFSHITDDHGAGAGYATYARDLKLLGGMSKFVVHTGDMLYANYSPPGEALAVFRTLKANIDQAGFGVPFLSVPGNHDNTGTSAPPEHYDSKHPLFCHGVYTKLLGPVRWSFDYGGCHFVGLDWKQPNADPKGKWENIAPQETVDWFKKDLARIPAGRRVFVFIHFPTGVPEYYEVIGRAAMSFGGHNHRVEQYNHGGPSITALNLRGNGSSNIGIVTETDFAVVTRCPGCKDRAYHSRLCGIGYRTTTRTPGAMPARMAPIRGEAADLPAGELGRRTVETGGPGLEIEVAIEVGAAKRAGLKIGDQEIVFDGEFLHVAGIPIPFKPWPEQQNTLTLHVAASRGMLIVYANELIRTHKPAAVGDASRVTIFAEGGAARLLKGTVRPLKEGVDEVLANMGYAQ
jgi:hypothetical protein